jgi:hypothetical protein
MHNLYSSVVSNIKIHLTLVEVIHMLLIGHNILIKCMYILPTVIALLKLQIMYH